MTENRGVEELKIRTAMARLCISTLKGCVDDPRQPEALAYYQSQLDKLEEELAAAIRPPDIVIGLRPAHLFGDIPKLGEY